MKGYDDHDRGLSWRTCLLAAAALALAPATASAEGAKFHEIGTSSIFGFTKGSDIGLEGEREIEFETTGKFGTRRGDLGRVEQEISFEAVPTQFMSYELSARLQANYSAGVPGLADGDRFGVKGLGGELRYLLIGRGPGAPIGVSVSVEPEWTRLDGKGKRTTEFGAEMKLAADTELVPNRLYAAVNLVYEPEIGRDPGDTGWGRESEFGFNAALAYRVTPPIVVGVEAQYARAYDGLFFNSFQGHALFVGPTLWWHVARGVSIAAAFSAQVAGHAVGQSAALDLTNFERYRGRLKLGVEF